MLSATEAFSGTPEGHLTALADCFVEKPVQEGEIIVEEDSIGQEVYLVLNGLFRVLTVGEGDEQNELRLLQKGDVFGEIAAVTGGRRMATVCAASEGTLLKLSQEDFQRVLQSSPEMVESICNSLARYFDAE